MQYQQTPVHRKGELKLARSGLGKKYKRRKEKTGQNKGVEGSIHTPRLFSDLQDIRLRNKEKIEKEKTAGSLNTCLVL